MVRCSVLGCKSDSERKIAGLSFHSFPIKQNLREVWIAATGRNCWEPKKASKICSKHFDTALVVKKLTKTYLDFSAVPTKLIKSIGSRTHKDSLPSTSAMEMDNSRDPDTSESMVPFAEMSEAESQIEETGVKSEQTFECRACLQILNEDCALYNIFEGWTPPWDGMENSIAEDLAKIANVQISESDRHSKIICETCCQLLLSACSFTAIVKKNDEILRQRYGEAKTQIHLSNDRVWPKPIKVDESIASSMYENVDNKKEVVSDDEQYPTASEPYDPSRNDLLTIDIVKIEPEEIIQQQPSQLHVAINGNEELDPLNTKESHLRNGNSNSGEIAKSMVDLNNKIDDELNRKRGSANACLNRQRELSRERSKRYRDKKRLSRIKKVEHAIRDTKIPRPSHDDPELTINPRITIHNSQIPRTSTNMNIPIVMNDYLVNLSDSENDCAGPSQRINNVIQANERSCGVARKIYNYKLII